MFGFIKNFWKEVFALTKTWSIRKQMLVCYIIAMIIILILILLVVVMNIYILRYETVQEMDKTLNEQANKNMYSIVQETAIFMHSKIARVEGMFGLLQQMLLGMYDENTFSLDYLVSYSGSEIPKNCWENDQAGQKVCMNHSSYLNFTEKYDTEFLRKISRFDNVWPSVLQLTDTIVLRYFMYFPQIGILKNFPGIKLPSDYDPKKTQWYQDFVSNKEKSTGTSKYKDQLGSDFDIITLVYPLVDNNTNTIGMICADLPILQDSYLFSEIYKVQYLNTGKISIAYKNGTILDNFQESFWKNTTSLTNASNQLWSNITKDYQNTQFFIFNQNIYRLSSYPVAVEIYQSPNFSIDD